MRNCAGCGVHLNGHEEDYCSGCVEENTSSHSCAECGKAVLQSETYCDYCEDSHSSPRMDDYYDERDKRLIESIWYSHTESLEDRQDDLGESAGVSDYPEYGMDGD